jgi:hypothetical protein
VWCVRVIVAAVHINLEREEFMSHLTTVKTQIKDMIAAADAAKELGCQFTKGGRVRYYYSTSDADYVLHLPGKYDLGFKKESDGTYSFVCDNELLSGSFGRNDASRVHLGEDAQRFRQSYASHVVQRAARRKGVSAFATKRDDGCVIVNLRG